MFIFNRLMKLNGVLHFNFIRYICCIIKANLSENMNLRRWVSLSLSSFQSAKIIIKTSERYSHTEMYLTFRYSSISIVNFYRFILWDGSHSLDADIQIVDSTISIYMQELLVNVLCIHSFDCRNDSAGGWYIFCSP